MELGILFFFTGLGLAMGAGGGGPGPVVFEEEPAFPDLYLSGDIERFPGRSHVYVQAGEAVKVECKARLPESTKDLHWEKKNGTERYRVMLPNEKGVMEPVKNVLSLPNAKEEDSGHYTCATTHKWTEPTFNLVVASNSVEMKSSVAEIKDILDEDAKKTEPTHITLQCSVLNKAAGENPKPEWFFNGKPLGAEGTEDSMVLKHDNGTIQIRHVNALHSGIYSCKFTQSGKSDLWGFVEVKGPGYVHQRHTSSKNMLEGEDVSLTCEIYGYPIPTVTWKTNKNAKPCGDKSDDECSSTIDQKNTTMPIGRFSLSSFRYYAGAKLSISRLDFADRAEYYCCARNGLNANAEGKCEFQMLRVKDKLAALWPFLGIVAEVLILVSIIFIYEKRRASKEAANDDPAYDQKRSLTAGDSDVRQRSVKA